MTYNIKARNLPKEIPQDKIDPQNNGVHIMWLYHNGYRTLAYGEMLDLLGNYIKDIVRTCSSNYASVRPVDYEDMYHEGCEEVMIRMASYDPSRSKPNTYFTKYIQARCYELLGHQYEQISPYYSKIAAKIRKAINICSQNNIPYNENKLSAMTGISVHSIHKTLIQTQNSVECSLEDVELSLEASYQSPEAFYLKKEEAQILASTFRYLDDMEREVLRLRVFHVDEDGRQLTYKKIAAITGYPVDEIKKTLNRAKLKITRTHQMKESFSGYYYEKKHRVKKKKIQMLPEESADIMEQQILDTLSHDSTQ